MSSASGNKAKQVSKMSSTITVAALQLPTLGMHATRIEFYLKKAKERGVSLMLFGEYVLNHFFKELETMPLQLIKSQSELHLGMLKRFSKAYEMTFVAPIITIKGKKLYKTVIKVSPESIRYYYQQILIPYSHWNEAEFFANEVEPLRTPMIFAHHGFKVMVLFGFEIHFPELWHYARQKSVDLVLVPTASTFASHQRWREILKMQAFIYGLYILRANRLGEYSDKEVRWKFYGDSMLIDPEGETLMVLEDRESMLAEEIEKSAITRHRRLWGFEKLLSKRIGNE